MTSLIHRLGRRERWTPAPRTVRRPLSLLLFPLVCVLLLVILVLGLATGSHLRLDAGFAAGVARISDGRLAVGWPEETAIVIAVLVLMRRFRLDWLAVRPGAIEVRPLEDAGGDQAGHGEVILEIPERREARLRRLNVEFREYLAGSRLYETTTVPGDLETERIIEVLKGTQPSGRLATAGAVWTYLWPTRAYIVTATLRVRRHAPRYGVSVTVRRLPGAAVELESQWSSDYERALQRAAFAVTAYVLPSTRACENPPWSHWRDKATPMPMELMRHYQRAKRMVGERRYDEALSLYHYALRYDADNVYLRYEIGQIFERLQLYPDALAQYAELTERIFPVTASGRRSIRPRLSPHSDPFLMRYRYLTTLSTGHRLARELLAPDWEALQEWLRYDASDAAGPMPRHAGQAGRPWRATELLDLRRRLADRLDPVWQERLGPQAVLGGPAGEPGIGLAGVLHAHPAAEPAFRHRDGVPAIWRSMPPDQARLLAAEQYFLLVAQAEFALVVADFRRYHGQWWRGRPRSSLTLVSLTLSRTFLAYRLRRFEHQLQQYALPADQVTSWRPDQDEVRRDLARAGYRETSTSWLEHYNAACFQALPLQDDTGERPEHRPFAEAAVRALDRAQRCGDDIEFVTSKRYWLLAGDPDLAGLRLYACFRAFESRVYIQPQPSTGDSAKYELFHYLRQGLARGARQMELLWLRRVGETPAGLDTLTLETWFREERRAWEMCVRLGRFHQQWQTRGLALEGLRKLVSFYDGDVFTVPYPEAVRDYNLSPESTQARLRGMEAIFDLMAEQLGTAAALGGDDGALGGDDSAAGRSTAGQHPPLINNTRAWIWFAEHSSRGEVPLPTEAELQDLCRRRAAVWTALRQWTTTPARRDRAPFTRAVDLLPVPPPVPH